MFAAEPTGVSVNTITRNTEINRGDHFVNKIKNTHRFVAETKQWHVYGQGVWAPVELKRVQGEALEFIKSQAELIAKIPDERDRADATNEYRAYAKKAGISNLTDLASIKLIENIDKFDSDDLAMCMNNCWVNLFNGRSNPPNPAKFFSLSANAAFREGSTAPLWRKTIDEVFRGDSDLASYFQKAVGYSMLGGNNEQVLFICHGAGANGKSLLLETIRDVFGSYGQSMPISTLMRGKQSQSGASPEVARLRGIRFALAAETEKGQRWSANRIKTLTGNDTIASRALYQDMIEFKSKATIWVACNHKPEVDAADAAMWRRIRLIPFERVFKPEEQDVDLSSKLQKERDGIMTWMIQGLLMYQAQGLEEPKSVMLATEQYRNEMDSVKRFIAEAADRDPDARETVSDIKDRYKEWCRDEGLLPLPASSFNKALEDHGCRQTKSGNVRYWSGLKLIDELERDFKLAQGF